MIELATLGILVAFIWLMVYKIPAQVPKLKDVGNMETDESNFPNFSEKRGCLYSADFVPTRDLPHYNVL